MNSCAFRLAPPTSAPSISGCPKNSTALLALTEPPYSTRTALAKASPNTFASWADHIRQYSVCAFCGGRQTGADRPDRLISDHQRDQPAGKPGCRRQPSQTVTELALSTSRCCPIGSHPGSHPRTRWGSDHVPERPAPLLLTVSSVSPKYCRRSE